jgi:DNA-binding PadR family transcriptional regulator
MPWATPQCNALLLLISEASRGLTRADLITLSGVKESSACARLKDMQDGGIIEVRGIRPGPYGMDVQVYHITPKGEARAKVLRDMKR